MRAKSIWRVGGEREDSYFLIALEQFLQHQRKLRPGEIYTAATLKVYHRRSGGGGVSFAARAPTYSLHPLVCVLPRYRGCALRKRGGRAGGAQQQPKGEQIFVCMKEFSPSARATHRKMNL